MVGHVLSGKVLAAVLASVVATGSAAAATVAAPAASHDSQTGGSHEQVAKNGEQNGPVANETGTGNGQGATISALAKSIPGGPGKGAQISAAARGHGQAVSAEARKNAGK